MVVDVTADDKEQWSQNPRRNCVVIGGRGFVGKWLVFKLLKIKNWIVRVADSDQSLLLDSTDELDSVLSQAITSGAASYHHINVRDQENIAATIEGSNVVFYMDVANVYNQNFYNSYMSIVQGAKNIVNACRQCKVKQLIYDSTADVVFNGSCDIYNGNESLMYPWKYEDMLTDLKAQAEALILFANDIDGLLTCAIRSCNVFGPGDSLFIPSISKWAKAGWSKFIIGTGENMCDFTYVENVAQAHVCAEDALDSRTISVAGKAFFITNGEPIKYWGFISRLLESLGYQRPFIKLPVKLVYYVLLLLERMDETLAITMQNCLMPAHYIVPLASRNRTFDCSAARKELAYSPVVSLEEGMRRTVKSFSHLSSESSYAYSDSFKQSKAEKLLGSGKVADVLLWRDEKTTFAYFLTAVVLFYWFFLSGRTFVSSATKLLLITTTLLFGYGYLPSNLFGFSIPSPCLSPTVEQDAAVKETIEGIVILWNRGFHILKTLSQGKNWNIFFKAALLLYFLKFMVSAYLHLAMGFALVFAFTFFFIYEQYESEVDILATVLVNGTRYLKKRFIGYLALASVSSLS